MTQSTNRDTGMGMHNENDIVHVEHLNMVFQSVQGYWRQKKHPVQAVKDISFSICKGELFGMVGPNGAGKTTTVKMLATLLLSMTINRERDFRTLPYLIASPVPWTPLFLGRSLVHIIDGLLSTLMALVLGVIFFPVDLSPSNRPLTRGIQAARLATMGTDWLTISPLFSGELPIGLM